MQRLLILLYVLISFNSNAQDNQDSIIHIRIFCGYGATTSISITNIQTLIKTKSYVLLKQRIFNKDKTEALLSVIALRELHLKRFVDLSSEELNQINKIVMWNDNYSICYTCTGFFDGTVNKLFTKKNIHAYLLIKSAIFNEIN